MNLINLFVETSKTFSSISTGVLTSMVAMTVLQHAPQAPNLQAPAFVKAARCRKKMLKVVVSLKPYRLVQSHKLVCVCVLHFLIMVKNVTPVSHSFRPPDDGIICALCNLTCLLPVSQFLGPNPPGKWFVTSCLFSMLRTIQ